MISATHDDDIYLEVLYTDNRRFEDVVRFNKTSPNKFDGVRMNYEGPWNLGPSGHSYKKFHEPVSSGDIEYFTTSKKKMGGKIKFY